MAGHRHPPHYTTEWTHPAELAVTSPTPEARLAAAHNWLLLEAKHCPNERAADEARDRVAELLKAEAAGLAEFSEPTP